MRKKSMREAAKKEGGRGIGKKGAVSSQRGEGKGGVKGEQGRG